MADTETAPVAEEQTPVVPEPVETPVEPTAPVEPIEPVAEPTPAAADPGKPKQVPWYMKRINQQSAKIADLSRTLETLVAEKTSPAPEPAADPEPVPAKPAANLTEAQIRAEAAKLVQQQRFDDSCNQVFDQGKKEFPDFEDTVRTLGAVGVINAPFLEAVTSLSEPAKILDHLGKNPDEAQRIAGLPAVKQAVELARIEAGITKKPAAVVSKAPAPIKPVGGVARSNTELSDQDDIATWMAKRAKQREARQGR